MELEDTVQNLPCQRKKLLADRYEVLGSLGSGGMGLVYKARDSRLDRLVAVKIASSKSLASKSARKRFEQEALAASNLCHQNIGRVYDYGFDSLTAIPYIAMEFIEGETLGALLARRKKLDAQTFIRIFKQAALALAHVHVNGIVHRDIKPNNLMITKAGDVKIVDFGIAKWFANQSKITTTGNVVGSPNYMSPEHFWASNIDSRSDIYSLGCTMYEALNGTAPFESENVIKIAYKQVNESPHSIINEEITQSTRLALESIVSRCLEKQPDKRFQSMEELEDALSSVEAGTRQSTSSKAFRWDRFTRRLTMIGAASCMALSVLSTVVVTDGAYGSTRAKESYAADKRACTSGKGGDPHKIAGFNLLVNKQFAAAEAEFKIAKAMHQQAFGECDAHVAEDLSGLIQCYNHTDRNKARSLARGASELYERLGNHAYAERMLELPES